MKLVPQGSSPTKASDQTSTMQGVGAQCSDPRQPMHGAGVRQPMHGAGVRQPRDRLAKSELGCLRCPQRLVRPPGKHVAPRMGDPVTGCDLLAPFNGGTRLWALAGPLADKKLAAPFIRGCEAPSLASPMQVLHKNRLSPTRCSCLSPYAAS
jgi:hypothetical protein